MQFARVLPVHNNILPPFYIWQTAHGEMDARDSTLAKLKHQLETEQKKIKEFEKSVPELEGKLSATSEQLQDTKHTLDEKMSVLGQTRKHLKNARERNMVSETPFGVK